MADILRVVQVSPFVDPERRDPEDLLEGWSTLRDVALAADGCGVSVDVVQGAACSASLERSEVRFRLVRGAGPGAIRRRLGFWAHSLPPGLVTAVAEFGPHVVHVHSLSFPQLLPAIRRELPDLPILVQDHGDALPPRGVRWIHRRAFRECADAVAFTAGEQAGPWIDAGVIPAELPIHEVLESSSHFRPGDRAAARIRTGVHGSPCLVWVGRLNRNKDPITVLRAVELAAAELEDVRLWCCFTEAPLLSRVQARIDRSPVLRDRVALIGSVPHEKVELLLRAADFLVLGSHREGSGYAVLEALACGTPPLVTDIPSLRRLTDGGRVGGLFPPGESRVLADLVVGRWHGDRAELRRLARSHFEDALSFEAVGEQLRAAYRAVFGSSSDSVDR